MSAVKPATSGSNRRGSRASARAKVATTAKLRKAAIDHSQRVWYAASAPSGSVGVRMAETRPATAATTAVTTSASATPSRCRRARTKHATRISTPSTATTAATTTDANDASLARKDHGCSHRAVAPAYSRSPCSAPTVDEISPSARDASVKLPSPGLVNCSMTGWTQHRTKTATATAPAQTVRRRNAGHEPGSARRRSRNARVRPMSPHTARSGTSTPRPRLVASRRLPTPAATGSATRSPQLIDHTSTKKRRNGSRRLFGDQGSKSSRPLIVQHSAAVAATATVASSGPPRR